MQKAKIRLFRFQNHPENGLKLAEFSRKLPKSIENRAKKIEIFEIFLIGFRHGFNVKLHNFFQTIFPNIG